MARSKEENEIHYRLRAARSMRLMFVRYSTAFMFFIYMLWSFLLLTYSIPASLLPAACLVASLLGVYESYKAMVTGTENLFLTRYSCAGLAVVTLLVGTVTGFAGVGVFFPFFSSVTPAMVVLLVLLAIQLAVIGKLVRIRQHRDKRYDKYLKYLDAIDSHATK